MHLEMKTVTFRSNVSFYSVVDIECRECCYSQSILRKRSVSHSTRYVPFLPVIKYENLFRIFSQIKQVIAHHSVV